MRRSTRRSRFLHRSGISPAIAVAIIAPALMILALALTYYMYSFTQETAYKASMQVAEAMAETAPLRGTIYVANSTVILSVSNPGPSQAVIRYVYLAITTATGKNRLVLDFVNGPNSTVATIYVQPPTAFVRGVGLAVPAGSKVAMTVDFGSVQILNATATAITSTGAVVSFTPATKNLEKGVPATLITFLVPSLTDLLTRSDIYVNPALLAPASPSNPGQGITGGNSNSGVYCLVAKYTNARIQGYMYYTAAYVGFDAAWTQLRSGPAQYTMLLVTTPLWGGDLSINGTTYTFGTYDAYRVVIYGYTGSIKLYYVWKSPVYGWEYDYKTNALNPANVVGIYLYAQLYGYYYGVPTSRIYLDGTAQKVYVYARMPTCGASTQVSYTPYMIIGDFDNDGLPEILFTTIDSLFDVNTNWVGDDIDTSQLSYTWYDLDDYSTIPFTIIFKGYPINSNKYIAVQIAIRYYFEDDAALDEQEIDTDKWILRVGLVDAQTGQLATFYELSYQYLTKHEDTYPPRWDYVIDTILLLVPQTGHTYYIELQFRDPYPAYSSYDDCDVMIGVEYLSISLIYQS
ncbi:MAG: hypothetical protein GXO32_01760 [Crenarchaeota archaeon]|nr:hypothetical protein [Thermoproteota archaeon]